MRAKKGFTLVEILIVVVILGILAAIVIPQFTDASTEAKLSSLCSDLQTFRSQLELYKIQHADALPTDTGQLGLPDAMLVQTNATGAAYSSGDPTGPFGPYVQKIPKNAFTGQTGINVGAADPNSIPLDATGATYGWYFNNTTGQFNACDTTEHSQL